MTDLDDLRKRVEARRRISIPDDLDLLIRDLWAAVEKQDQDIDRLTFEYERADEAAKRLGTKWKEATNAFEPVTAEELAKALHEAPPDYSVRTLFDTFGQLYRQRKT
jgi:hypothetical protein